LVSAAKEVTQKCAVYVWMWQLMRSGIDDGVALQPVYMPGSQGQANKTAAQFNLEGSIRLLESHSEYIATIVNDGDANPAKCELYIKWAEMENNQ